MTRAYGPRLSTLQLLAEILAVPGVADARLIAPTRGTHPRPARIRVTLDPQGMRAEPARTDFTLPEARAWLAAERRA